MKKETRGITLIALVITIIVLLVLAGVTIAMVFGEDGILTKGQIAKEQTNLSSVIEEVKLAILDIRAENRGQATLELLKNNLPLKLSELNASSITDNGDGSLTLVNYKGYDIVISSNYTVTGVKTGEQIPQDYTAIYTATDLQNVQANGNYRLMNDIDLSGVTWNMLPAFNGTLEGNGKKIKNVKLDQHIPMKGKDVLPQEILEQDPTMAEEVVKVASLVNKIGQGAKVQNLTFENITYGENTNPQDDKGTSLFLQNYGTIENVKIIGNIIEHQYGNFLCMVNNGTIIKSGINAKFTTISNSTALGYNLGTYEECYLIGNITGNIISLAQDNLGSAVMKNCLVKITTEGDHLNYGVSLLCQEPGTNLSNCYAELIRTSGSNNIDINVIGGQLGIEVSRTYYYINGAGLNVRESKAISLTEAQSKQKDSFTGFDFNTIWEMQEGISSPTLQCINQ